MISLIEKSHIIALVEFSLHITTNAIICVIKYQFLEFVNVYSCEQWIQIYMQMIGNN